jgi:hypothetical protein
VDPPMHYLDLHRVLYRLYATILAR